MKPLQMALELASGIKREGLTHMLRNFFSGFKFIRLAEQAARPRIVLEHRFRASPVKVDTGLPDLGAEEFFKEFCIETEFLFLTIVSISLLFLGTYVFYSLVSSSIDGPTYWVTHAYIAISFIVLGLIGIIWMFHMLMQAGIKASSNLTSADATKLVTLIQKNADVACPDTLAVCDNYTKLAKFIVQLRYSIAAKDSNRSIKE